MSLARAVQLLTAQPVKASGSKKGECPPPPSKAEATFALNYLDAFGYLQNELSGWKDIKLEDVTKAIGLFQGWFGLKQSKLLTPATVKAMEWPRCGHPDCLRKHKGVHAVREARVKAFVNSNLPRWTKDGLTYGFASFVTGISKDDQRRLVQQAFDAWSRHGNISVAETKNNTADIVIGTGQGARSNFDGPGGTLAWAYLPDGSDRQLEMRFDLGETWTVNPAQRGILYLNVATHEIGHLFGLDHSKVQSALMAPYYNAAVAEPQANDDVPRFQARYGTRTGPVVPATPAGPKPVVTVVGDVQVVVNGRQVA